MTTRCALCERLLIGHAAGELDAAGRSELAAHLDASPACADEARALQALFAATTALADPEPPAAALTALKRAARAEIARRRRPDPGFIRRLLGFRFSLPVWAPAALAVLLFAVLWPRARLAESRLGMGGGRSGSAAPRHDAAGPRAPAAEVDRLDAPAKAKDAPRQNLEAEQEAFAGQSEPPRERRQAPRALEPEPQRVEAKESAKKTEQSSLEAQTAADLEIGRDADAERPDQALSEMAELRSPLRDAQPTPAESLVAGEAGADASLAAAPAGFADADDRAERVLGVVAREEAKATRSLPPTAPAVAAPAEPALELAERLLEAAREAEARQDTGRALVYYDAVSRLHPGQPKRADATVALARLHAARGEIAAARAAWTRVLELDPARGAEAARELEALAAR